MYESVWFAEIARGPCVYEQTEKKYDRCGKGKDRSFSNKQTIHGQHRSRPQAGAPASRQTQRGPLPQKRDNIISLLSPKVVRWLDSFAGQVALKATKPQILYRNPRAVHFIPAEVGGILAMGRTSL